VNIKNIPITTSASGAFVGDVNVTGEIMAVAVDLGTLSTPDITLTDLLTGDTILAKTGLATDKLYEPRRLVQDASTGADIAVTYDRPVVMGKLHVVIAGAGDTLSGAIRVAYRG